MDLRPASWLFCMLFSNSHSFIAFNLNMFTRTPSVMLTRNNHNGYTYLIPHIKGKFLILHH